MNTRICVIESAQQTLQDPNLNLGDAGYHQVFLSKLEANASQLPFPAGDNLIDCLGYALFNQEASTEERTQVAAQAIDGIRAYGTSLLCTVITWRL